MRSYRENPDGEENQKLTRENERYIFALKEEYKMSLPNQRLMNTDCWLIESQTVDGIIHELYQGHGCGFIRVMDEDSNKMVSLIKYPSFQFAENEYNKLVKLSK